MSVDLEELFVSQVDVGIATMDVPTEDGVISAHMVVQQVTATDRRTGQERQLMLIFSSRGVVTMADALREAAEKATQGRP
ncbi:hypothetical protein [Streptosporangium sp. NPDC000396]|uniref:hypothetical protein n=1 Tax=Streptosporangium sp. NPDC000396 TaxID=3366185 RepID=UPI0036C6DD1B